MNDRTYQGIFGKRTAHRQRRVCLAVVTATIGAATIPDKANHGLTHGDAMVVRLHGLNDTRQIVARRERFFAFPRPLQVTREHLELLGERIEVREQPRE